MGLARHLYVRPRLRQESQRGSPLQARANRPRPHVDQGHRRKKPLPGPGSLLQCSEEAFGCLGRVLVAEARREGGLPQGQLSLECQRNPVRGGRRGLRRQSNHCGTVKAEQQEVTVGPHRQRNKARASSNSKVLKIFAFSNNHYAGHSPATAKLFWDLWNKKQ